MHQKAIITGITGQDGAYLSEFLLRKKIKVYGIVRRSSSENLGRIHSLKIGEKINFLYSDLQEHQKITKFIQNIRPNFF